MKISIVQKDTSRCFICHSNIWLEWHHIWGGCGAIRDKSDELGLVVRLCHYCHNEPPYGVHQNKEIRTKLQAFAQKKAMAYYGWDRERFIKEFYKNYLEEDEI
jgi:hypothetical protein